MGTVDEAWKVPPTVVDEGLAPILVERAQSQLVLMSTAHRRATALMVGRRAGALGQLSDPEPYGAMLLVEWSAWPGCELDDRRAWRQASPYWTAKRERTIAGALARVQAGESVDVDEPDPVESFRTQWLNIWPGKRLNVAKGETLIEEEAWRAAHCEVDSDGPLVIGVEDHHERGAAVAFCGTLPDGRLVLGGQLCASRAAAYGLAAVAARERPGSTLVIGASLASDAEVGAIGAVEVRKAGIAETAASLSTLRELLGERVTQDGSADLEGQMLSARVTVGTGGLHLVAGQRCDLLRAAVWALRVAVTQPPVEPAIHRVGAR
jgi:hypothetical protein